MNETANKTEQQDPKWERQIIEKLAMEALKEKRRSRYWGIFFKFTTLAYLVVLLLVFLSSAETFSHSDTGNPHTALVTLDGVIASEDGVAANVVVGSLQRAFEHTNTQAVILHINSPGGSPVQSSYIQKAMKRLRVEHPDTPLYAVVSDICASGGYYVASAADKIYVNESSIVGSIGVLMDSFGFEGMMDTLGIERRLLTAGEHKGILDPFSPLNEFDRTHAKQVLEGLHQTFIKAVQEGRGDRLSDDPKLFSGLFWSGQRSIELGLADAIGSVGFVAREIIEVENIVDFTQRANPFERLADRIGVAAAKGMMRLLEGNAVPRF